MLEVSCLFFFFFQAEDGIRDRDVTGVQTCALPILACVGGRIVVQLPAARPPWLTPPLEKALTAYDLGAPTRRYDPGDEYRSEERRVGKECRSLWARHN